MGSIFIPNRLNWIDWAKCLAISFVVFGHTPQVPGSFPQYYIVTFHMPFFFFISGYLTKKEYFSKTTLRKYWHTIIIPYFIYNFIYYPYWIVKHTIEYPDAGLYDYCKPLIGTLMLQCSTKYYESLNGVTWFLVSLLAYKIILSICNKYRYGNWTILFLMIISSTFYAINEFQLYTTDLPVIGFSKCMAFFFIGHFCRQKNIMPEQPMKRDWYLCVINIGISLATYLFVEEKSNIPLFALRFWLICITASWGILSLCKLLNNIHSSIVANISIGTIVIMALHFILISTTNFAFEHLLHLDHKIIYPWYIALMLTLIFEMTLYPLIILFKNKYPFMLGKNYDKKQNHA